MTLLSKTQILAYLNRIGIDVKHESCLPQPSLKILSAILQAHLREVPFENLAIHIPRDANSDDIPLRQGCPATEIRVTDLFAKIVEDRRGGICFELNVLLHALLVSLGFAADLSWSRLPYPLAEGEIGIRWRPDVWHVVVLVRNLESFDWFVDAGWGGGGCSTPIPLTDHAQRQGFGGEPFRLVLLPRDHLSDEYGAWALESDRTESSGDGALETSKILCRFGTRVDTVSSLTPFYIEAIAAPHRFQPHQLMMYRADGEGGRVTFSTPKTANGLECRFAENEAVPAGILRVWKRDKSKDKFVCIKVQETRVEGLTKCKDVWLREFGVFI